MNHDLEPVSPFEQLQEEALESNLSKVYPGYYIEIEGLDGCYKSTTVDKVKRHFEQKGFEVVVVRQPGGTPLAEKFRTVMKEGTEGEELYAYTEMALALGSRAQLIGNVVKPALLQGKVVIADRGNLSTIGYQSYSNLEPGYILQHIRLADWYFPADALVVINTPYAICRARIEKRFEEEGLEPPNRLEERLAHCETIYSHSAYAEALSRTQLYLSHIHPSGEECTSDDYATMIVQGLKKEITDTCNRKVEYVPRESFKHILPK